MYTKLQIHEGIVLLITVIKTIEKSKISNFVRYIKTKLVSRLYDHLNHL